MRDKLFLLPVSAVCFFLQACSTAPLEALNDKLKQYNQEREMSRLADAAAEQLKRDKYLCVPRQRIPQQELKDWSKASLLDVKNAAESGDPSAQTSMAAIFREGKQVRRDDRQVYIWGALAVANGDPRGQEFCNDARFYLSRAEWNWVQASLPSYFYNYSSKANGGIL
ncbi:hypothetical protein ACET85_20355 [Aeromonas veronii]|uniref:hypothetical protein n=1 Tax=Aeromonas TaxID=642 RepID=UPI003446EC41